MGRKPPLLSRQLTATSRRSGLPRKFPVSGRSRQSYFGVLAPKSPLRATVITFAPAARSPRRPALSTRDTLPPQVPPFVATDRTICSDCVSWPSQLAMAVTVDARLPLMTATRRLTAIMAADVAGYSRLMGADEEVRLAGDPHQRGSVLAEVHPGATHHVRVAGWKLASAPLLQRRRRHRAQFEHELLR